LSSIQSSKDRFRRSIHRFFASALMSICPEPFAGWGPFFHRLG